MSVTLGSLGTGESLVGTPSTTTLATKGILVGPGVQLTTDSTNLSLSTGYYCILTNSTTTFNFSNVVLFDTALFDSTGMHDTVNTGRINILSDGLYSITASMQVTNSGHGDQNITINKYIDDTATTRAIAYNSYNTSVSPYYSANVTALSTCAAGDYITINMQGSGYNAIPNYSPIFSVVKLSR